MTPWGEIKSKWKKRSLLSVNNGTRYCFTSPLDKTCTVMIGLHTSIGDNVHIGPRTRIGHRTVIEDHTTIGDDVLIDNRVNIGYRTDIASNVYIGSCAYIGNGVCLGERVNIRSLSHIVDQVHIKEGDRFITLGPIGSRNDMITIVRSAKRGTIRCWTGCFGGTIDEFLDCVKETHGNGPHGVSYRAMIRAARVILNMKNER